MLNINTYFKICVFCEERFVAFLQDFVLFQFLNDKLCYVIFVISGVGVQLYIMQLTGTKLFHLGSMVVNVKVNG